MLFDQGAIIVLGQDDNIFVPAAPLRWQDGLEGRYVFGQQRSIALPEAAPMRECHILENPISLLVTPCPDSKYVGGNYAADMDENDPHRFGIRSFLEFVQARCKSSGINVG